MRTDRGGYRLSMVESDDDESCGSGKGSESDSVLGEVDDGTESVFMLSVASNKFKVHGKRKKKSHQATVKLVINGWVGRAM